MVPGISMIPVYEMIISLRGMNHYWPLWLMCGANPFNVMLFRSFFNGIPMAYLEAARIDGLSDFKIFIRIIIPLSVPIIMVVSIFSVTTQWSSFMWPYLILSDNKVPMSVKLFQINSLTTIMDNERMAIALFAIIPPVIVYAIFSKYIMGGVSMTGIKG